MNGIYFFCVGLSSNPLSAYYLKNYIPQTQPLPYNKNFLISVDEMLRVGRLMPTPVKSRLAALKISNQFPSQSREEMASIPMHAFFAVE